MLEFRLNPAGRRAEYLRGLNAAHPGWGDETVFDWWYRRRVGGPPADFLTILDGDELVAGMSVSWRTAARAERRFLVGIMGGAWTLPSHRRRGCFREVVERAGEAAELRRADALLAFIGRSRPSTELLDAVSDVILPSWALRTEGPRSGGPALRHAPGAPTPAGLHALCSGRALAHIEYPEAAFAGQARLDRPGALILAAGPGRWAAAEVLDDTLQVWTVVSEARPAGWLGAALVGLAADAARAGLGLSAYTTDGESARIAAAAGVPLTPISMYVVRAPGRPLPEALAAWDCQALDRA